MAALSCFATRDNLYGPKTSVNPDSSVAIPIVGAYQVKPIGWIKKEIVLVGTKQMHNKGTTVTSSVTIISVNQITGPRQWPLEIAWKKAEVGES
ncbi:MAG: hypothetical protein E6713_07735 [Sporomusaceae bacterium]|nr:hypothetical protein [Sporomusaceae bacterium]